MLSKEMEAVLNAQVNAEDYSAYLYGSMANYFEAQGLKGFANWFQVQASEERGHARKIEAYVNDRGGRVLLKAIDAPKTEWKSAQEVFEDVVSHEQHVTKLIYDLSTMAMEERDHATHTFLEWFVSEQVEEEASAGDALNKVKLGANAPGAMLYLDREFGSRGAAPAAE